MKTRVAQFIAAWLVMAVVLTLPRVLPAEQKDRQPRTLTGHVFNSENQPLQGAIVYLKNMKNLQMKTYITKDDGSYSFPPLSPDVDYEVYAAFQGAHSDTKTISSFDSRKQFVISLRIHSSK